MDTKLSVLVGGAVSMLGIEAASSLLKKQSSSEISSTDDTVRKCRYFFLFESNKEETDFLFRTAQCTRTSWMTSRDRFYVSGMF